MSITYPVTVVESLNLAIRTHFPFITPIDPAFHRTHEGVSRLVMLDRYAQKDRELKTLMVGDFVICIVRDDPKFPSRGLGTILFIDTDQYKVTVLLEEEFRGQLSDPCEIETGLIIRNLAQIEKPLELYYEQIAHRVGHALAQVEATPELQTKYSHLFTHELEELNLVPAGRVLYGAGSETLVTYFNCFVMPYIRDSRSGISDHRKEVMEIMSRGGGVGTNGSTLRPHGAIAKGVGGKSSGAVSWLNDIANLTNLVEQGGSRRGAQMIMLADWHPDIFEFIISKMQNPLILEWLSTNSNDEEIRMAAFNKLKFVPLSNKERTFFDDIVQTQGTLPERVVETARQKLMEGGHYEVNSPDFLTGANISVTLTKEFMQAVEDDTAYELRFPIWIHILPSKKPTTMPTGMKLAMFENGKPKATGSKCIAPFVPAIYGTSFVFVRPIPPNQEFSSWTMPTT